MLPLRLLHQGVKLGRVAAAAGGGGGALVVVLQPVAREAARQGRVAVWGGCWWGLVCLVGRHKNRQSERWAGVDRAMDADAIQ